jgi:hypothetical protein
MQVVDAEGSRVGWIHKLLAERRGDALCVTTIMIGEVALLERIIFRPRDLKLLAPRALPWDIVDRIDGRTIWLRVTKAELPQHPVYLPDVEHAPDTEIRGGAA